MMGRQGLRHRNERLRFRWPMLGLVVALAAAGNQSAWADERTDLIGGKEIIPINEEFNPPPSLILDGSMIDILDPEAAGGGLLGDTSLFSLNIPTFNVSVELGAALASAISGGNRPSVLTPYAGILGEEKGADVYDTFGSLVTNKATTLGKGKFGIGMSYQHARFSEFDGEDIGKQIDQEITTLQDVSVTNELGFLIETSEPFSTRAKVRARGVVFEADVVTLSLTYGLLENLDVGALIPYIWLNTRGRVIVDIDQAGTFQVTDPGGVPIELTGSSSRKFVQHWDRDFDGIGDIILFTKYQILSQAGLPGRIEGPIDLALQLELKLASGNDSKFLGTGETDVALRALVQRQVAERLVLRTEVGVNHSGIGNAFHTFEYKVGAEYELIPAKLAASAEIIGSYSKQFHGVVDIAGGVKYSVSRDFKVFGGLRAPLNDNGLRYSLSPIVGLEYTFSRAPQSELAMLEPASADQLASGQGVARDGAPVEGWANGASPDAGKATAAALAVGPSAAASPSRVDGAPLRIVSAPPMPASAPVAAPPAIGEAQALGGEADRPLPLPASRQTR